MSIVQHADSPSWPPDATMGKDEFLDLVTEVYLAYSAAASSNAPLAEQEHLKTLVVDGMGVADQPTSTAIAAYQQRAAQALTPALSAPTNSEVSL